MKPKERIVMLNTNVFFESNNEVWQLSKMLAFHMDDEGWISDVVELMFVKYFPYCVVAKCKTK